MTQTITITPRWQIHIPLKIRKQLNLTLPGKAEIQAINKNIVIKPQPSLLLKMSGKYKEIAKKRKVNLENIRDVIDYNQL